MVPKRISPSFRIDSQTLAGIKCNPFAPTTHGPARLVGLFCIEPPTRVTRDGLHDETYMLPQKSPPQEPYLPFLLFLSLTYLLLFLPLFLLYPSSSLSTSSSS